MAKKTIQPKQTLSKCCGVAYDYADIERIIEFCNKHNFKYYIMKHLADMEEEEKEHYHFIIESDRQHRFVISSLLTDTFKHNLFEPCENVGAYLRYMTHIDYALKHHYSIDEFISNVSDMVISCLIADAETNVKTKQERSVDNFYAVIEAISCEGLFSICDIITWCRQNDIPYDIKWTYTLKTYIAEYSTRSNKFKSQVETIDLKNIN